MNIPQLQELIRGLAEMVRSYTPDFLPYLWEDFDTELKGYGHSKLTLAVHKETDPEEFAVEQATFMLFLGESVCPRILAVNFTGYVMEYLKPVQIFVNSLYVQELFLEQTVWSCILEEAPFTKQVGDESWRDELKKTIGVEVPDWALDTKCLIHGDPTLDNTFLSRNGNGIRIADPIPPHRLLRPSIKAIDHGKILQSFLGWEVVLRGVDKIEFAWPDFMCRDELVAKRAIFWCMVSLKRIALRNSITNAGSWAERLGKEIEKCVQSF